MGGAGRGGGSDPQTEFIQGLKCFQLFSDDNNNNDELIIITLLLHKLMDVLVKLFLSLQDV